MARRLTDVTAAALATAKALTDARAAVLDESFGTDSQHWELRTVYQVRDRYRVRVRIQVGAYPQQSYAVAEVLTPGMTWSELVAAPTSMWFGDSPNYRAGRGDSSGPVTAYARLLAADLVVRAAAVLPD